MLQTLKRIYPDLIAVGVFLLLGIAYFFTPLSEGLVLSGHDTTAAIGQGHSGMEHLEKTGEVSRWTDAMFSGMPTYQTSPSYPSNSVLSTVSSIISLRWLFNNGILNDASSGAATYIFLYLLGFYILLRAFRVKPWISAVGAVAWAFSSYFLIIIAAGHIWKVITLAFIPPTIAGLVLCYRGKYLWGTICTALFTGLQVLSNHIQMSYYFGFVMLLIVLAYGIDSLKNKTFKTWLKATGCIILGGFIGVFANITNLYHTYQYAQQSMRGPSELTAPKSDDNQAATDGLSRDYITQWSYGIDETMTLLVPDFKGGGSGAIIGEDGQIKMEWQEREGFDKFVNSAYTVQEQVQNIPDARVMPGLLSYWGDQPFTVGPVYVGAFILFLFFLGIVFVKGPMKWALTIATALSLLMAWGRNFMPFTDFMIDWMPMYSKFRTVSSALVIAEFTIPLLATLTLVNLLRNKLDFKNLDKRLKYGTLFAALMTVVPCLWLIFSPGLPFSAEEQHVIRSLGNFVPADQLQNFVQGISQMRGSVIADSALRSLFVIILGLIVLLAGMKGWLKESVTCILIAVICLVDLWTVDKNYLNDDNFADPTVATQVFEQKTPADEQILQDTSLSYRVLNLTTDTFSEADNRTAYLHKSIGGYHAAKLHRYQDLIEHYIAPQSQNFLVTLSEMQEKVADDDPDPMTSLMQLVPGDSLFNVLNMLNAKYMIVANGRMAVPNIYANGNAWFVQKLTFVDNADAEMAGLKGLDTKHAAIADKRFENVLNGTKLGNGEVTLTQYAPNELHYAVNAAQDGVVVFSEVFYPGWTAKIDGNDTEIGRVNYILRAVKVPAGKHEIVMEFRPASITTTEILAFIALAVMLMMIVWGIWREIKNKK